MDYVVAARGDLQVKAVLEEGCLKRQKITPFVGARRNGVCEVGLGLLDQDDRVVSFYAPDFFKNLLQSWRGMRIFHHLTHVWEGTLKECYKAADPDPSFMDKRGFDSLREQIGYGRFQSFLDKMRVVLPEPEVLDAMIRTMEESGIRVDVFELQCEIREGRLYPTPYIKSIVQNEVDSYKRHNTEERARHEAEIERMQDEALRRRGQLWAKAF